MGSGSSIKGISQARILEWVAISFSRGSSQPKDRTHIFCIAGGFFTTEPPGKPIWCVFVHKKIIIFSTNARLVIIRYYRTEVGEIVINGIWRDIGILECETSPLERLALVGFFNGKQ